MTNAIIWQRANGSAAMILFWGLVSAYTYVKYFT